MDQNFLKRIAFLTQKKITCFKQNSKKKTEDETYQVNTLDRDTLVHNKM